MSDDEEDCGYEYYHYYYHNYYIFCPTKIETKQNNQEQVLCIISLVTCPPCSGGAGPDIDALQQ